MFTQEENPLSSFSLSALTSSLAVSYKPASFFSLDGLGTFDRNRVMYVERDK